MIGTAATPEAADTSSDSAKPSKLGLVRAFSSLRHRQYRLLWTGTLFTQVGFQMQQIAMGWLVYELTRSAWSLSVIGFFGSIPMLLFSLIGGTLADRFDRRRLLIVLQGCAMLVALVVAVLVATGLVEVWHLGVTSFAAGTTMALTFPTRQALVPGMVPRHDLANAIALSSVSMNATRVFGPALAGLILGTLGTQFCFLLQAVGFVGAMWMVFLVQPPPRAAGVKHLSILGNLLDGLKYIRDDSAVFALMSIALVPAIVAYPYIQFLPAFAAEVLKSDAGAYSLLMSAQGVGALVGSLAICGAGDYRRKGLILLGSVVGFGTLLFAFAATNEPVSAVIAIACLGLVSSVYLTVSNTLLQLIVPDQYMGRVMSAYILTWGLMPIGTIAAGPFAERFGVSPVIAVGGALCVVFGLFVGARKPLLRSMN